MRHWRSSWKGRWIEREGVKRFSPWLQLIPVSETLPTLRGEGNQPNKVNFRRMVSKLYVLVSRTGSHLLEVWRKNSSQERKQQVQGPEVGRGLMCLSEEQDYARKTPMLTNT